MTRATAILAGMSALLLAAGCDSFDGTTKEAFASAFTCPQDRITVRPRPDVVFFDFFARSRPPDDPAADVKADPQRLSMWKEKVAEDEASYRRARASKSAFEASGCGHKNFYSCSRSAKGRISCSAIGTPPGDSSFTLAELAHPMWKGESDSLNAPGMVGSFEAFDPLANFDWILGIARAWNADAVITRVRIDGVSRDGTVNFAHNGSPKVRYEIQSPGCARERPGSGVTPREAQSCGLEVIVALGDDVPAARLILTGGSSSTSWAIERPKCSITMALDAADKAGQLASTPVHRVELERNAYESPPVFRTDSAHGAFARIDASSCQPSP
jgi:hypothetical protein